MLDLADFAFARITRRQFNGFLRHDNDNEDNDDDNDDDNEVNDDDDDNDDGNDVSFFTLGCCKEEISSASYNFQAENKRRLQGSGKVVW